MTNRIAAVVSGVATVIAFVALGSVSVVGQTHEGHSPAKGASGTDAIRTSWGDPDLGGIWTTQTLTPLERPAEFAGKAFLTPEEAAAYEAIRGVNRNQDRRDGGAAADVARAYNDFWWDRGTKMVENGRTSLIIDPQDGRIPYNLETRKRAEDQSVYRVSGPFNSSWDVDTGERCITDGLPIVPGAYNNNFQILQTPDSVAILHEMFRDRRIIPLDGRPTLNIRQWLGDPRGHWEGETLVVETINFDDKTAFRWAASWRMPTKAMRIVERFTRVSIDTIDYEFTIQDPSKFTGEWTASVPMTTDYLGRGVTGGQLYEYACHEGNYAIVNVLTGARTAEQ
jgi:hypothetical protein